MKAKVYNQNGKEVEEIDLPKQIFGVKMNQDLVHQVLVSQMANKRQPIAHTKDRSEVSGGGKKPWRQKGTGRARHGSIRSPIWKGGGVAFGPTKERNFKKIIPKKMNKKAIAMALSEKAKDGLLILVDKVELKNFKTNEVAKLVSTQAEKIVKEKIKPKENKNKFLIVVPKYDKNFYRASRNIPYIGMVEAVKLSLLDIVSYKYLFFLKDSLNVIKERLLK
ncbi:50S ribosomal protein L4 [bacterium]|nr:50S ribosomal protein L4 [bacterium]